MADPRPNLVFLKGPQAGQRTKLKTPVAVAGRQGSCEVPLKDEYASRQHMRLSSTPEGWTVEILSAKGMRIGAKKYKQGQTLFLETGDVMFVGSDTEILFVDGADDVEAAIQTHAGLPPVEVSPDDVAATVTVVPAEAPPADRPTDASPMQPPFARAVMAGPRVSAGTGHSPAGRASDVMGMGSSAAPSGDETAEDKARQKMAARTKKVRKYAIGGGIYVVLMIGLIVVLSLRQTVDPGKHQVRLLSRDEIASALKQPIEKSPDPLRASDALQKANTSFPHRQTAPGDLYAVVKLYKLYMAYTPNHTFLDPEDEAKFKTAQLELENLVIARYEEAYKCEKSHDYDGAFRLFKGLLQIVPELDGYDPSRSVLGANVMEHIGTITTESANARRR